jgi:hypothetical protein
LKRRKEVRWTRAKPHEVAPDTGWEGKASWIDRLQRDVGRLP